MLLVLLKLANRRTIISARTAAVVGIDAIEKADFIDRENHPEKGKWSIYLHTRYHHGWYLLDLHTFTFEP